MDIELAIDAMELSEHIDQMVLFSGDGDFRSLVEAVQRRGVQVTVISTVSTQPAMIADELRRQADVFTDLIELHRLLRANYQLEVPIYRTRDLQSIVAPKPKSLARHNNTWIRGIRQMSAPSSTARPTNIIWRNPTITPDVLFLRIVDCLALRSFSVPRSGL